MTRFAHTPETGKLASSGGRPVNSSVRTGTSCLRAIQNHGVIGFVSTGDLVTSILSDQELIEQPEHHIRHWAQP